MWHSSERVYLCTSEWFSDFQFLTTSVRTEYCVFFELSLKTIRPSWVFTGSLIYSKERLSWVRPHPGTKNSSKKLSVGRRGGVDDWGKKGKGKFSHSRPTYPPPPPSTPRTCLQAKLLHPYSNNASLIADFSRIFTTFFLCHCYRFWTKHWNRKERHAVMCYSRTRSFKLAPLPSPWNRPLADKSKYFRSTAGLFRVNTVLS